jgi:hypothetical protein
VVDASMTRMQAPPAHPAIRSEYLSPWGRITQSV